MNTNGKNIVLIGMPGSGKSTIGKILSKRSGHRLIDIDKYIEMSTGKSITELFEEGEDVFRSFERKAINKFSNEKSIIISTGGGTVKDYRNMEALKKNGIIFFIDRPIESIAANLKMGKRPLLKDGIHRLYSIYNERYELYRKYSTVQIVNDSTLEDAVNKIINYINGHNKEV